MKEGRRHNSTYPKGGVSCSKDSFVVNGSLVFKIMFCAKNPRLRQYPNRWRQPYEDSANFEQTRQVKTKTEKNH